MKGPIFTAIALCSFVAFAACSPEAESAASEPANAVVDAGNSAAMPRGSLAADLVAALNASDEAVVTGLIGTRIVQTYPGSPRMERRTPADIVKATKGCAVTVSSIRLLPGENSQDAALVQANCPASANTGGTCAPRTEIEVTTTPQGRLTRFVFWNKGEAGTCTQSAALTASSEINNG